jgi:superfamily II DNA or RNA helicase
MLQDVQYPAHKEYRTGSPHEPLEFYMNMLLNSTHVDFLLGYFSSSAINLLALGFAKFISSGGTMRIIINNVLSPKDKAALQRGIETDEKDYKFSVEKYEMISQSLNSYGVHFFECLSWLIAAKRIEIVAIKPKNKKGISHFKSGIFSDGNNKVKFKGSVNFTAYGLAENLEELGVHLSWDEQTAVFEEYESYFNNIFTNQFEQTEIIDFSEIETRITEDFGNKDLEELLVDEEELIKSKKRLVEQTSIKQIMHKAEESITEYLTQPKFPGNSEPRGYQKEAYENWVNNDYKGIFAMATGTGKTITALNCILNEYLENGFYKFIVFVPTTALASQWIYEVENKFNFRNTILCCSSNSSWREELSHISKSVVFERDINYAIVTTYATFKGVSFQAMFKDNFIKDFDKITLIADEAHNLAAPGFLKVLPEYLKLRIGLSATPERQFDENGNSIICDFFNSSQANYTFEYDMKIAIQNGFLCRYYYYPIIVNLETKEQEEYLKITKKLAKYFDPATGKYKESDYVNSLLIRRKNIIHKANQKIGALVSIVNKVGVNDFKNAFIYVPEGSEADYSDLELPNHDYEIENDHIIEIFTQKLYDLFKLKLAKFTGETKNRDQILKQFSSGKLDALLAMKCLDEGVDIPQTKYAIFCSSTGNPRQYIQRRGRVLRNFTGKNHAIIYDLIVKPKAEHTSNDEQLAKIEKNIFLSELRRLVNFAVLSENKDECLNSLEQLAYELDIDIYDLANKELDNYKQNENIK